MYAGPQIAETVRPSFLPSNQKKPTSTIQISLLEPAAHGTEVSIVAVPSGFCVTIFSKKLFGVNRSEKAKEVAHEGSGTRRKRHTK